MERFKLRILLLEPAINAGSFFRQFQKYYFIVNLNILKLVYNTEKSSYHLDNT